MIMIHEPIGSNLYVIVTILFLAIEEQYSLKRLKELKYNFF